MAKKSLNDETRARVARSVLTKNLAVRPGERVLVEAWPHTVPWASAIAREARRIGASPLVVYEDEAGYWDTIEDGDAKRLGSLGSHEWAAMRESDVYIHMWGPGDRVRLNALPAKVQESLFAWNDQWYKEARKHKVRGARLELGRPYPSLVRAYGVDADTWTNDLVNAILVDPATLARRAAPIEKALSGGTRVRIRHPNGTDLTLGLKRRPAQSNWGVIPPPAKRGPYDMLVSLPSGRVNVALDESVADGTIVANRTSYFEDGTATGTTLHFADGRLTEATFDHGAEQFEGPFAKAGKGRDQPGMLRIGLNPGLHNTPQLEDLERGAVMVSVGGNRMLGGSNSAAFFGFAITAGARVEVDGKTVPI